MTDDCHHGNIATKDSLPDDTSVGKKCSTKKPSEDFDSNLSQHSKGDNDHTRQHLGGLPPLRSRGREDSHSTNSSEKGSQRDRNREELSRPDHVSVRSSYWN